jgi:hypothetical protein
MRLPLFPPSPSSLPSPIPTPSPTPSPNRHPRVSTASLSPLQPYFPSTSAGPPSTAFYEASSHSSSMMRSVALLLAVASALLPLSFADVKFTTPIAEAVLPVGSLSIAWTDSGDSPALAGLTSYQLFLCAGGNDDSSYIQLLPIVNQGLFMDGNQAIGTITAGLGASSPANA